MVGDAFAAGQKCICGRKSDVFVVGDAFVAEEVMHLWQVMRLWQVMFVAYHITVAKDDMKYIHKNINHLQLFGY